MMSMMERRMAEDGGLDDGRMTRMDGWNWSSSLVQMSRSMVAAHPDGRRYPLICPPPRPSSSPIDDVDVNNK